MTAGVQDTRTEEWVARSLDAVFDTGAGTDGFETHSHGRRKAKGRRRGQKDGGGSPGARAAAEVSAGRPVTIDAKDLPDTVDGLADDPSGLTDLTLVTVRGQPQMFSAMRGNGVPRAEMPQIPKTHLVEFQADLKRRGVKTTPGRRDPSQLKATQSELNGTAVGGMQRSILDGSLDPEAKPMWISNDGHVLDGHHRWAAAAAISAGGRPMTIPVIEVDLPMSSLLGIANEFNDAHGVTRKAVGQAAVGLDEPPFEMVTDLEDGIDPDLVDQLPAGDGTAFDIPDVSQSSSTGWFKTHSHGKRKNKGRKKGKADDAGGEPRGGGAGGTGTVKAKSNDPADFMDAGMVDSMTRTRQEGTPDFALEEIARRQGFDGKPGKISAAEADAAVAAGSPDLYRGFGTPPAGSGASPDAYARQFTDGPYYGGRGRHGSGTYTAPGISSRDAINRDPTLGAGASTRRMVLHPDARVIASDQLANLHRDYLTRNGHMAGTNIRGDPASRLVADPGRFAAMSGYDAITTRIGYVVILNRTAVSVVDE